MKAKAAVLLDISVRLGDAPVLDNDDGTVTELGHELWRRRASEGGQFWGLGFVIRDEGVLYISGLPLDDRHGVIGRVDSRAAATAMALPPCVQRGRRGRRWAGLCTVAVGYKCTVQFSYFSFSFSVLSLLSLFLI